MELMVIMYRRDRPRIFSSTAPMSESFIVGVPCPLCPLPVMAGQDATFVVLGPGDDAEARERHINGLTYPAQMVALHQECYDPASDDEDSLLGQLGLLVAI